jgi:Uma2 family endonuclease
MGTENKGKRCNVVSQTRTITAEYFNRYIMQPQNRDRNFELIAGEIVEKMVSNPKSSAAAAWILGRLSVFVDEHDLGHVTGADGGYVVAGERYIPDAAFISRVRQAALPLDAYNPLAPDLAIEVLSPSNSAEEMRVKISSYLAAGTVLWIIDLGKRLEVHRHGLPALVLGEGDTLEGGDILPGFQLSVSEILSK